ncbi:MAG: AraC family transcriptional regulator ligand-binding domain-containing protein [Burkholderiaceae bacterium]|nr:AraC family transcriptional regulator ligand-binding domain-containing protein [Burkholderiaceae bacterium]
MTVDKVPPPAVPARYFALLCDLLDEVGIGSDALLNAACLDGEDLALAGRIITLEQLETLLAELRKTSARSDLAYELGGRIKLHSHDVLSFALMSSPTLDHMLGLFARFDRLISPILSMSYLRVGNDAELTFRPVLPMTPQAREFWVEATAVAMVEQIKAALPAHPLSFDVFMPIAPPPHVARYAELAGLAESGAVKFHFARNPGTELRIHVRGAQLDLPLPTGNADLAGMAERRCQALLSETGAHGSWGEWVGAMLRQNKESQLTLNQLAALLNVTARTLHRYLNKEGTSFREIATRVRAERARVLLGEGRMAISEIAYSLGYTDVANFSRSFKRINGICPTHFRSRQRSRALYRPQ